MNAGEVVGTVVGVTVLAVFLLDRILKPWRERILADAAEKRAVALIQSDEMRKAFKVLTGTPADPNQGVDRVKSLGERMTDMEQSQQRVEKLLNGGGLGAQMTDIGARMAQMDARQQEHLHHAETSKDEILGRIAAQDIQVAVTAAKAEQAALLAGEAATTVSSEVQRIATALEDVSERVEQLDETVVQRLFIMEDAERTHRAMLHEVGLDVDLPTLPDDDDAPPPPHAA